MNIAALDAVIIVAYLLGIMAIGIYVGFRKNTSSDQFFLAGKSLKWPIIGLALFTSNISTIHLVGLAADGYRIGLVVGNFEWMASFTLVILGLVFVPFYFRSGIRTLPEFLEKRYGQGVRMYMAGIMIFGALLIHIGMSLYAGAVILEEFFGFNLYVSIIVISLVTATYTILGGLKAVVVTDAIQAVLLLVGAVILTVSGIFALQEAGIALGDLKDHVKPRQLSMVHGLHNTEGHLSEYSWLGVMFGYFVLGIWYWCTDQTIVQKVLGAKSEKDGRSGAIFAGFLKILPVFLMVFPGVIAYVLFKDQIQKPNDTLVVMMRNLLPTGLLGLMTAGMLAALMSTIEAALNSTATVVAEDIVKKLKPQTPDKKLVLIGRITAGIVVLLAMAWSTQGHRFSSIFEAINKIPMIFAPALTTVFVMGVFWKRGTRQAAMATLIGGTLIGLIYFIIDLPVFGEVQLVADPVNGLGIPFMMVGLFLIAICIAIYAVTSLMTPAHSKEDLKDLCWDSPLQAITQGKFTGASDPRTLAGALVVLMLILYAFFH